MSTAETIALISAIGGLPGLGGLIAAIGAWRKSSLAARELKPDHGSSVADKVALLVELQRSQGHQIGEIRDDMTVMRQHIDRITEKQIRGG